MKGPLAQALKTELTEVDQEKLRAFAATLPEGRPVSEEQVNGS
jgi:hypothetical protein